MGQAYPFHRIFAQFNEETIHVRPSMLKAFVSYRAFMSRALLEHGLYCRIIEEFWPEGTCRRDISCTSVFQVIMGCKQINVWSEYPNSTLV